MMSERVVITLFSQDSRFTTKTIDKREDFYYRNNSTVHYITRVEYYSGVSTQEIWVEEI